MPKKASTKKEVAKEPKKKKVVSDEEPKPKTRQKECPECGSGNVSYDAQMEQLVCQDCGHLFEEVPRDDDEEDLNYF